MNLINKTKEKIISNPPKKYRWIKIEDVTWNPSNGDKIEGRLISRNTGIGKYNQNMYVIRQDDNQNIIVWGKTQLDRLMMRVEIKDYIRITYNGKRKTSDDNTLKIYKVEKREENPKYNTGDIHEA